MPSRRSDCEHVATHSYCARALVRGLTLRRRAAPSEQRVFRATLNNLGNAYAKLATGDREENLRAAIEAYEAALTVLTEEAWPERHATATGNLEAACAELAARDAPHKAPRRDEDA